MPISSGAILSPCETYRYVLWRVLEPQPGEPLAGTLLWVMLNPSTADATADDATIRKVCGFARRWGYREARVVNLYALRSRDPKALWKHQDPVGPENDDHLRWEATHADAVVLAWGANAGQLRAEEVRKIVLRAADPAPVWHLGLTQNGHPKHPLMLGYDTLRSEIV